MANLSVKLGSLRLNNPILVASGTFGYGKEFSGLVDLNKLGAIITKTVTLKPRPGNPMPRTVETPCGLLNCIGLQNEGIDNFIKDKIPYLTKLSTRVIASVSGNTSQEFKTLVKLLDAESAIDAIELNLSCPNIGERTALIAQDAAATYQSVRAARKHTKKALITKLSPNVTDIVKIARSAEKAGSDALSLINTLSAMSIDLDKQRPHLAGISGGLSGPAIKPIALYMVYCLAQKIKLPIIGIGGIMNARDALEFILAGAAAIEVGTANFVNPQASAQILAGIKQYLIKHKIKDIRKLTGALKT